VTLRILVAGQGAWGRALAGLARSAGCKVETWVRGQVVPPGRFAGMIVAVPAQAVRAVLAIMAGLDCDTIILAAKGIENGSQLLMPDVARLVFPLGRILVLSGPSFADDVAKGLPTAVTLAADSMKDAAAWAQILSQSNFRIYASDDVRGVALGGALKNVLAIASGISDGKGLGESARAALTARGFAELRRLGLAMGARSETLMGLSGLGDLLLTCGGGQSRNYSLGFRLGSGQSLQSALAAARGVVEGALTAHVAHELAHVHQVDMPIVAAVAGIIHKGLVPDQAIAELLDRPVGPEID
jgi:glycerol-3-phosphate dehydrogenase (NAD(P)+)